MSTGNKNLPDILNLVYELEAIYKQGQDTSAWETTVIAKQQEPSPREGTPPPDTGRGSDWDYPSSHTPMPENAEIKITPRGKEYWLRTEPAKKGFFGDEYLPVPDASGTEPLLEGTRVNPKKIFFHGDDKERISGEEYFTGLDFGPSRGLKWSDIGAWFSDSEENARYWAETGWGGAKREGVVNRVNLSMENPRIFKDHVKFKEWLGKRQSGIKVQRDLKKQGYDGIIIEDSSTDNFIHRTDVVVFDQEQIKVRSSSPTKPQGAKSLIPSDPKSQKVLDTLSQHGKPYLVGGGVRDALLGRPSKDVDIEVHGIEVDDLAEIVERDLGGKKEQVGKQFGVFVVDDFDIALPRTETKTGAKHTDFDIKPDPNLSLEQAVRRRDFTINALMYDVENDEILDFFGGQDDIKSKNIKHVSEETFVEDPLRVYRAAQFAARFDFSIDPSTQKLARSMDLSDLPKERVFGEVQKMLLKSSKPSVGIQALDDMDVLDRYLSEISDLKETDQRDDYHAEGDVFIHTKMALDEAAKVIKRFPDEKDKTIIMLATLCHDLGKPATTNKKTGQAIGHEDAGVDVAKKLLDKLTNDKEIVDTVLSLVKHHLKPGQLYRDRDTVKDSVFRRLINTHGTKFLDLLSGVAEADTRGRLHREKDGTTSEPESEEVDWFRKKVEEVSEAAGMKEGKLAPLVS